MSAAPVTVVDLVEFGMWLYEHFDELADEFKSRGRFLTLQEITKAGVRANS